MFKDLILVGCGGFVGSIFRYGITVLCSPATAAFGFPVGTFSVNCAGSLLMGLLLGVAVPGNWFFFTTVGFCGGFTTFSAFSAETFNLFKSGNSSIAMLYVFGSIALGVLLIWLGMYTGQKIIR